MANNLMQNQNAEAKTPALGVCAPGGLHFAVIDWLNVILCDAIKRCPDDDGDIKGVALTKQTILSSFSISNQSHNNHSKVDKVLEKADKILECSFTNSDQSCEPLAAVIRAFSLEFFEFKFFVLALAPELDDRFQRSMGYLLDDMNQRVGTIALYCDLLGFDAENRVSISKSVLWQELVFENSLVSADEPLRIDPYFARWLLGDQKALAADTRICGMIRTYPWPGRKVLEQYWSKSVKKYVCESLLRKCWVVLTGDHFDAWRSLLEFGSSELCFEWIRIEPKRFANVDAGDIEHCARLIGRMSRFTGIPVVVDIAMEEALGIDDRLVEFMITLSRTKCTAVVICREFTSLAGPLNSVKLCFFHAPPLSRSNCIGLVRCAAQMADAELTNEEAESIFGRYALTISKLEEAMRLAQSRPVAFKINQEYIQRFKSACQDVAVEGLSRLSERIEPCFHLDDVVLPEDRKSQLREIVNHVELTSKVLDEWRFRDQLPYGRGVTALLFGPSGTGKTMAAQGIANELGVQLLRVDLSRIVSKYIGDTEKNIDRIFSDAERSGSALLFDEAEALLGKRSEVKDAHDRYANIEVAYVLQRMEEYDGLAILTTNLRQNLDSAFLRRLRFIIDFPRPDAAAREQIWKLCLPSKAHALEAADFRQLSRKIDLTGGHIRQITIRAAFSAAAENRLIHLLHIADAAKAEFAKLGLPPVELNLDRRAA
ncbi:ATP-binding protein [Gimesia fumaroli]|nr:ATP-binding protein [Gimesia fumaroli]